MKNFNRLIVGFIERVLISWGIYVHIRRDKRIVNRNGKLLNIGCGSNLLSGFINCDIQSDHYHPKKKSKVLNYDMRKDLLPFGDEDIDGIYCSHVLEHIESRFVEQFFFEAFRVLKPGCVLRIVVPDPQFIFKMYQKYPEYFSWHKLYDNDTSGTHSLVRLLSATKSDEDKFGLAKRVSKYGYGELMELLRTEDFCEDRPERHINNWDFDRIKKIGISAGFRDIINSKMQGSVSKYLQGADIDQTHPAMSLYLDLVK